MEVCCERALRKVFQCWENGVKTLHALYNKVFSFYGDEVISWRTEQTRLQPTRRPPGPALAAQVEAALADLVAVVLAGQASGDVLADALTARRAIEAFVARQHDEDEIAAQLTAYRSRLRPSHTLRLAVPSMQAPARLATANCATWRKLCRRAARCCVMGSAAGSPPAG
jgi:hypothetical protein